MRGTGRAAFTAFLLLFVGTLNIFYGIGGTQRRARLRRRNATGLQQPAHIRLGAAHPLAIELTGGLSLLAGKHLTGE